MLHATAFAESTNVFMPYYRQCGMTIMKKAWLADGDINAAIGGMPYSDIRDNVAKRTEAFKRVLISAEPRTIGRAVES